ncbi:MAG: glycosyltransferase family 25 protein [Alphaproteobacteria bacterium]|nr:glycosyltransferase family 25 protein [Alphaproteobacteria bacterium]
MIRYVAYAFFVLILAVFAYPVGYYVASPAQSIAFQNSQASYAGIGAYVINLDRSKDRLDFVLPRIQQLGIPVERVPGVDGSLLSEEELNAHVDMEAYKSYMNHYPKKGMVGCCLSHIKTWRAFLDSGYAFALIFEDDVQFDPAQLKKVVNQLMAIPELWDLNSFEISHKGTPLTLKELADGQVLVTYTTEITHAGCYLLNRRAAQKLLEKAFPINLPIDHYFARPWEFGLRFTGVENPRIVHQNFGNSVIGASVRYSENPTTVKGSIYMAIFKVQSYAIRFVYGWKTYFL